MSAGDLSLTLQAVAQMGYEGVEFAGYYDRSAKNYAGCVMTSD